MIPTKEESAAVQWQMKKEKQKGTRGKTFSLGKITAFHKPIINNEIDKIVPNQHIP